MIEITNLRIVYKSNQVAEVDFYIPKWKLHLKRARLCQTNDMFFINPPAYKPEGADEWIKIWQFDQDLEARFMPIAKDLAVAEYNKKKESEPDPLDALIAEVKEDDFPF